MFSDDDLLFVAPEQALSELVKGNFARRVLVLQLEGARPLEERDFLLKILAAAQVNLDHDTHLAMIPAGKALAVTPYLKEKEPAIVLVFGLPPAQIGLQIPAPSYEPFTFYGCTWLFADSLATLEPDKQRKGQLWKALQVLFLS
jgi:hypothetical protein